MMLKKGNTNSAARGRQLLVAMLKIEFMIKRHCLEITPKEDFMLKKGSKI